MPVSISSPKPRKNRTSKSKEKGKNPFEIPNEKRVYTSTKSPKRQKPKRMNRSSLSQVKTQSRNSVSSASTMITLKKSKKVSFKMGFVDVIEVQSFKKYNDVFNNNNNQKKGKKDNVKCGCVIF